MYFSGEFSVCFPGFFGYINVSGISSFFLFFGCPVGCLRNGGEDDEVAAMAASGDEEVRGEDGGEEAGGLRSGEGECRWS